MVSYIDALKNAARTAFCQATSPAENAFDFWDRVGLPDPLGIRGTAANIYRSICNKEPPPLPPNTYPVGKCPVMYRIVHSYSIRTAPDQAWIPFTFTRNCPTIFYGPLSSPEVRTVSGQKGIYIDCRTFNGSPYLNVPVVNGTNGNQAYEWRTDSWSVSRCDGQADDCGTGTITPPQPGYRDVDIDITYQTENNVDITIPTTVNIGSPIINLQNDIVIPITYVQVDAELNVPIEFYADFNISTGDINIRFGGNDGVDRRPGDNPDDFDTDDPLPPKPPGSGGGDTPTPEVPEQEKRIVAVVVTVTDNQSISTSVTQSDAVPVLLVPDVGNVRFLVRVNKISSVWTGDIPIRQARQFVPCPWDAGAVDVEFSPRPGVTAITTPVYRKFDVIEEDS